jgi:WD40 repeat protein
MKVDCKHSFGELLIHFPVHNIDVLTAKTSAPLERPWNPGLETTWTFSISFLFACDFWFLFLKSMGIYTNRYAYMHTLNHCSCSLVVLDFTGGDNIIVGTYDKKVMWFDLDLSTKPYQTLRHHGNAIRSVAFHRRYPLFASGSDDCSLIVCHGMVYK